MIEFWYCPIFDKEIDEGLCWDISNIGNDSLCLSADERPPCGWEEAYKICKACQHYIGKHLQLQIFKFDDISFI